MAYYPEGGFDESHWDYYAEQLMMSVLGAGSPTYPIDQEVFDSFTRQHASFGEGEAFVHLWFGSKYLSVFSRLD